MLDALLAEPPFRFAMKAATRVLPCSIRVKDRWGAADRPHYLAGVLYAADQARREGRDAVSVIEFGVAEGYGLIALQAHAEAAERETGVTVVVYSFDSGRGLPVGIGDYRDHPDVWHARDYAMDVPALKAKLTARTTLVLGEIRETVQSYAIPEPLGFISVDVDLYLSAVDTLRILFRPDVPRLRRIAMYFDDLGEHYNHRWATTAGPASSWRSTSSTPPPPA